MTGIISLDDARWALAKIWFPTSALIVAVLALQTVGNVYADAAQRVWSWALPNFLPTLALMVSVFAQDAIVQEQGRASQTMVRRRFLSLAVSLSTFYICLLVISIVSASVFGRAPIEIMEMSNIWLAPVQGLVVASLGVLFFVKEETNSSGEPIKPTNPSSTPK